MPKQLAERIYQAQCLGNVEPIEYMTPYPNLGALVEGQTIKHHGKMVYSDLGITNIDFYNRVCQIANWLTTMGVKPKQRVHIFPQEFPLTEMLIFGVWTLGGSVILSNINSGDLTNIIQPHHILDTSISIELFDNYDKEFNPAYKPLLGEEALIFINNGRGIRLSQYNLLINANDVQRKLQLGEDDTFFVNLDSNTTAWVVLQAILPFYAGACITNENPQFTIGLKNSDYIVDMAWTKITDSSHLYILPENTAILSVGKERLMMTAFNQKEDKWFIQGHSVMMGYLDNEMNETVFTGDSLAL